jgi:hypothetical protein
MFQGQVDPRGFLPPRRRAKKQSAETTYADRYHKDMRASPYARKTVPK